MGVYCRVDINEPSKAVQAFPSPFDLIHHYYAEWCQKVFYRNIVSDYPLFDDRKF